MSPGRQASFAVCSLPCSSREWKRVHPHSSQVTATVSSRLLSLFGVLVFCELVSYITLVDLTPLRRRLFAWGFGKAILDTHSLPRTRDDNLGRLLVLILLHVHLIRGTLLNIIE